MASPMLVFGSHSHAIFSNTHKLGMCRARVVLTERNLWRRYHPRYIGVIYACSLNQNLKDLMVNSGCVASRVGSPLFPPSNRWIIL